MAAGSIEKDPVAKKLPASFPVGKLKLLCKRLFDLEPELQVVVVPRKKFLVGGSGAEALPGCARCYGSALVHLFLCLPSKPPRFHASTRIVSFNPPPNK
jgi:hypothetical protein